MAQETGNTNKLIALQLQVEDVKIITKENIHKVLERGEKIDDLEKRADDLIIQTEQFKKVTVQVKRRLQWRNRKCLALLILVIIGVILVVTLAIVLPVVLTGEH